MYQKELLVIICDETVHGVQVEGVQKVMEKKQKTTMGNKDFIVMKKEIRKRDEEEVW